MKRLFSVVIAALSFSWAGAFASGPAVNTAFEQEVSRLSGQLDRGEISALTYAAKEEELARTFFPEDKRAHEFFAYKKEIIGKRERNEMTREQAIAALAAKHDSLFAEAPAQQAPQVSGVFSAQPATEAPSQAGRFLANFASTFSTALTRNAQQVAPQRPTNCTSSAIGGAVQTSCY